ncbi:3-deoxy-manno-octulosonate cytidylyltransferase (CMP-KDO synthetase) [Chitinophaga ginsengisegetis]|uniref:3-deoxy-manno-octulosonate cytidylyltransferase (CMP-KDO synthetase) n=1 Tax=Chitinophaga ginsengisegetis TaxID=393003 RepID=A0A1T5P5D4_9BACT|nr:3-deoxy-manno-octulosonate cytidylyltransferase [Chitinophaga ginsengisegetis]SKD07915.1 3-deoxy-manno-octulosonate cytidylyltransferase (CMP-KDO synthetase) [Chitinophaga ginsengisegetis]
MKIIGVIPARFRSSRFPGKPLVEILNKPMIIHVAEIVEKALGKQNTFIATDDEQIKSKVEEYGFQVVMTPSDCLTGTDRVWEVAKLIKADIYINVQGDEPMLNPDDIKQIAAVKAQYPDKIINGMFPIDLQEDPQNVNIPKVLANKNDDLVYMSRLAIPGIKEKGDQYPIYFKQVCIYAFNYKELEAFGNCKEKAEFEKYEDIEILRFFDLGIPIKMVRTSRTSLAVDIPDDVKRVEEAMRNKN